jgi:hypothetical protein
MIVIFYTAGTISSIGLTGCYPKRCIHYRTPIAFIVSIEPDQLNKLAWL